MGRGASNEFNEEASKDYRGNRHRDKATHDHRWEEATHQEVDFGLVDAFFLANTFGHNGIKREAIKGRQRARKPEVRRDLEEVTRDAAMMAMPTTPMRIKSTMGPISSAII